MHFGGVQKQKYKNRVPNCIFALYHSIVGITLYKTLFRVKSLNNFCKSPHNFHIRHTHTENKLLVPPKELQEGFSWQRGGVHHCAAPIHKRVYTEESSADNFT